jgi:hypothetical protein
VAADYELGGEVTIRPARSEDRAELRRLAELETRAPTPGPHLLALREGDVVASISLATVEVLADPFQPTADVQELLRLRAGHASLRPRRASRARRLTRPALSGA